MPYNILGWQTLKQKNVHVEVWEAASLEDGKCTTLRVRSPDSTFCWKPQSTKGKTMQKLSITY